MFFDPAPFEGGCPTLHFRPVSRDMHGVLGWLLAVSPVPVDWDASPACGSQAQVEAAIAERLDPALAPTARARARVREHEGTWSVEVRIFDEHGELGVRRVTAESCESAVTAVAVVVALAVVEQHEDEPAPMPAHVPPPPPSGPEPASAPADAPPPAVQRRVTTQPDRDAAPSGKVRWDAQLDAGVAGWGAGPAAALLQADVAVSGESLHGFAGVAHRVQRRVHRGPRAASPGAALRLTAGRAGLGVRLRAGPLEIPIRVGTEWGVLWAQGRGVDTRRTAQRLWAAALGNVALGGHVSPRVALLAGVELNIPLLHTPLMIDGQRLLTTGPVGVRGLASLRVRLDASFSSNR